MRLYVGNIPWSVTSEELSDFFGAHGPVESVFIVTDRETGKSRGFAFVSFQNEEDATSALTEDGAEFQGRTLRVNPAVPKPQQPRSDARPDARAGHTKSSSERQQPRPRDDRQRKRRRDSANDYQY